MEAMDGPVPRLTIEELAARAGVRVRTIRFYIADGLLPGPGGRGRAAAYTDEHLARLRLIRRLVERHVPLAEIRALLARLSADEVRALLAEEDRRAATLSAPRGVAPLRASYQALLPEAPPLEASAAPPSPTPAPAQEPGPLWRRIELAPGLELHVRHDVDAIYAGLIRHIRRQVGAGPHRNARTNHVQPTSL